MAKWHEKNNQQRKRHSVSSAARMAMALSVIINNQRNNDGSSAINISSARAALNSCSAFSGNARAGASSLSLLQRWQHSRILQLPRWHASQLQRSRCRIIASLLACCLLAARALSMPLRRALLAPSRASL